MVRFTLVRPLGLLSRDGKNISSRTYSFSYKDSGKLPPTKEDITKLKTILRGLNV